MNSNNKIVAGVLASVVVIGAAGTAIISGDKGGPNVVIRNAGMGPAPIVQPFVRKVTEADVADRAWVAPSGRAVHVVGNREPEKPIGVSDTPVGRAVVVDSISSDALCTVVFDAKEITVKQTMPGHVKVTVTTTQADVPKNLVACPIPAAPPLKIPGSGLKGSFIWYALLKGNCCADALTMPGYLGSSMDEFLKLPAATQARVLKTTGACSNDGGVFSCIVPVGDHRAVKDAEVFFPMELAGRYDLKFMPATAGKVKVRHELPK